MTTPTPEQLVAAPSRISVDRDRFALRAAIYLFSPFRWFGTVVLENALGLFFLCAPYLTLRILGAPETGESAVLFRLYGAVLIHRGLTQQIFYRRRVLGPFRQFVWASLPFSFGSTVVLAYAVVEGFMAPLVGWIVVASFAWDFVDNVVLLWATRSLPGDMIVPRSESGGT